jgi:ABC-type Fe3+/spermidine/putrescine transport system ATPase subunit
MTVIEVSGLRKLFGDATAVANLDLQVSRGEVLGLLGPSGCGKTTTLRCIAGLERPSDGRVVLDGKVVNDGRLHLPPERRGVGMVFQSYALWPHMTVEQNVAFPLTYSDVPKSEHSRRTLDALEAVGLQTLGDRYPSELSGGQQQRVAVARAISPEPAVLLFDEPLSNLDARMRNHVRLELKLLLRRLNATAVYVTHDQKEAMALCDRIAVMSDGYIRQIGTPEDIYQRPVDSFVATFVGDTNVIPFSIEGDGAEAEVVVAGQRWLAPEHVSTSEHRRGQAAVRPEHIQLVDQASVRGWGWPVEITERLFLGSHTQYLASITGTEHQLRIDLQDGGISVGAKCFCAPDPESIVWLPGDDATHLPREVTGVDLHPPAEDMTVTPVARQAVV